MKRVCREGRSSTHCADCAAYYGRKARESYLRNREEHIRKTSQRYYALGAKRVACFRCLQEHPNGEEFCYLAAEYNGWPWRGDDRLSEFPAW